MTLICFDARYPHGHELLSTITDMEPVTQGRLIRGSEKFRRGNGENIAGFEIAFSAGGFNRFFSSDSLLGMAVGLSGATSSYYVEDHSKFVVRAEADNRGTLNRYKEMKKTEIYPPILLWLFSAGVLVFILSFLTFIAYFSTNYWGIGMSAAVLLGISGCLMTYSLQRGTEVLARANSRMALSE
ncbi:MULTISPECIES: DUF2207 domain-containing protein [unclassified Azospirillum]|uniref:DUF2207 domain-containing protein n=1 Tax=unclassified Azospirillum TaxID=2630922 RepID=UPI0011779300|nr:MULTISPECIES: DUF2207 domain-containing protein [unclassified Azospirillum]